MHPNNVAQLAVFNGAFSGIYITGFITPFTGETPEQVKARLRSVPEKDRFTAVMVESYRLASNPLPLDIMSVSLAQYYVQNFTTSDLSGVSAFLKRDEIARLADGFDPSDYDIPKPSPIQTPKPPITRRDALVALYNATDGPQWARKTNWLSDSPLGEWYGVTTDGGRVTDLNLEGNHLRGQIPSELGSLSNLTWLNLARNQLTGAIPAELGNLSNLTWLRLWDNHLTGEIPAELGGLSHLSTLTLSYNQLSGEIPAELGNLSKLRRMRLNDNRLSGEIPAELGSLSELAELRLSDNRLSGEIPSELGNLDKLTRWYLHNNWLTGCIPDGLRYVEFNDWRRMELRFCAR